MTRGLPTGFTIVDETQNEKNTLRVELPTKNGEILFEKKSPGNFDIYIVDNSGKRKHKIGENVPIAESKKILEYVLMPH
jgi:hypothetical protein